MSIIGDTSVGRPDWQGPPWLDSPPYDNAIHLIPAGQTYQSPPFICGGYKYIGGLIGGLLFDGYINFDFNTRGSGNTSTQNFTFYTPGNIPLEIMPLHVPTTADVFDFSIYNAGTTQASVTTVVFGTNRAGPSPFALPNGPINAEDGTILNTGQNPLVWQWPWGGFAGLGIECTDAITWGVDYYAANGHIWNPYIGQQALAANTPYYQQIVIPPAAMRWNVNYAGSAGPSLNAYVMPGAGMSG